MFRYLLVALLFVNVSCASYLKRKECEKKNWFDYGKSVALKGERLGSDHLYGECIKVSAEFDQSLADQGFKQGQEKYCQIKTSYDYGKSGKFYNFSFCDSPHETKMRSLHAKGVKEYCHPNNGYPQGKKGVPYNNICPSDLKSSFLVGFHRGRIKFLKAEIKVSEKTIQDLTHQIRDTEHSINDLQRDIRRLPRSSVTTYEQDANGQLQKVVKESERVARRRSRLNALIANKRSQLRNLTQKQSVQRQKIRGFEKEISLLD